MAKTRGWKTKPSQAWSIFVSRRRDGKKVSEQDSICPQIPAEGILHAGRTERPGSTRARGFLKRGAGALTHMGRGKHQVHHAWPCRAGDAQLSTTAPSPVLPRQPGCMSRTFCGTCFYEKPNIKPMFFRWNVCIRVHIIKNTQDMQHNQANIVGTLPFGILHILLF